LEYEMLTWGGAKMGRNLGRNEKNRSQTGKKIRAITIETDDLYELEEAMRLFEEGMYHLVNFK